MKITFRQTALLLLWAFTLWVAFWGGFYKSQMISSYSQYLSSKVQLADHKALLRKIEGGDAASVREGLVQRISVETSLLELRQDSSSDLLGWVINVIYPREAITLISVYDHHLDDRSPGTPPTKSGN